MTEIILCDNPSLDKFKLIKIINNPEIIKQQIHHVIAQCCVFDSFYTTYVFSRYFSGTCLA
jgi:hypothetical protein